MYFNPHSRKGSDRRRRSPEPETRHFNPHSRKGSDFVALGHDQPVGVISIHTPARGVTPGLPALRRPDRYFNPHSRKGSDWGCRSRFRDPADFNPHSRKGSDPPPLPPCGSSPYFNPHSRKGSDGVHALDQLLHVLFQSTLPQGE